MILNLLKKWKITFIVGAIALSVIGFQYFQIRNLDLDKQELSSSLESEQEENIRLSDLVQRTDEQLKEAKRRAAVTNKTVAELQRELQDQRDREEELEQNLEELKNENIENEEYLEQEVPDDIVDYVNGNPR